MAHGARWAVSGAKVQLVDDYLNFSGNIFPFCVVRYFKTFVDIQMLISQQNHSNVVNEEEHNLNFSSENHNHRLPRQQTCRQSATKTWQKRLRRKFYGFQNWWTILKLPIYPPTFLAMPRRLLKRRYISVGLDLCYVLPARTRIEDRGRRAHCANVCVPCRTVTSDRSPPRSGVTTRCRDHWPLEQRSFAKFRSDRRKSISSRLSLLESINRHYDKSVTILMLHKQKYFI